MTSISTIELGRVKLDRHVPLRPFCTLSSRLLLQASQALCALLRKIVPAHHHEHGRTVGQGDLGRDAQGNSCTKEEDTRVGFWISDNDFALLIIQDCRTSQG
jgi:hypothetical protein